MKKILITGAAGYLGSTLAHLLSPDLGGHWPAATFVDDFRYGQDMALADLCSHHSYVFVRGDCRDERIMKPLIAEADVIFPLAAIVGAPACETNRIDARGVNFEAVYMIVRNMSRQQRIVLPMTNSGYGVGGEDHCTELSPLNPISYYGVTKCEAEKAVLDHPNGCSLRFATLFGMSRRMRLDLLVNDFVWRAVNDKAVMLFEGHFRRNFVHVQDAARALKWFGYNHGAAHPQFNVYNIGHPEANVTKRELCEEIAKQVPGFVYLDAPIGSDPDQRDYVVSNERMLRTGFHPNIGLQSGIMELRKGFSMMRRVVHGNA